MFKSILIKKVAAVLLAAILLFVLGACKKEQNYVTGDQWLITQKECLEDIKAFSEGMDEVFTLYSIGAISDQDFVIELSILSSQYDILIAKYEKLKAENPVKEGSHTYYSQRGTEAIQKCYDIMGKLLESPYNEDYKLYPPNEVAYRYMSYHSEINNALAEYITAYLYYEAAQESV